MTKVGSWRAAEDSVKNRRSSMVKTEVCLDIVIVIQGGFLLLPVGIVFKW